MIDFIYRDNVDKLKALPSLVYTDRDFDGILTTVNYNQQGSASETWLNTRSQCQHCGVWAKKRGLGMHRRSLRCYAMRAELQAKLEGYVRAPIQYNSLTSPFARRYPTGLQEALKTLALDPNACKHRVSAMKQGHIHMQVWYELWFAELWLKHLRLNEEDAKFTSDFVVPPSEEEKALVKIPGKPMQQRALQLPESKYMPDFINLADAKRKHAPRRMERAKLNLVITRELTDV